MEKRIIILTIIVHLISSIQQSLKHCDPSHCNHEGQCFIENDLERCECIGDNYFQGPRCTEIVDNCLSQPCQNGGQCLNLVGQFICQNCQRGFGGLWCDVEVENAVENMALYFNHYGYYSQPQRFLIIVERLGSVPFSLELLGDNYVIDSFETTDPQNYQTRWTYSSDLIAIIKDRGIRYHNDLPYAKGYYHESEEVFWELGMLKLTLRAYDIETASQFFYFQNFDFFLMSVGQLPCVPQSKFLHGSDPMDPLLVDIARFNNFEAVVLHRCATNSIIIFEWRIFNSIGNKMLHNFGRTKRPLLKVPPYRLWFNYHGEVMSSYSLVMTIIEHSSDADVRHETRCFILVLPKPVQAIINGGNLREVSNTQSLIMDGSSSRDFALAPLAKQDLLYQWDCVIKDDADHNPFCKSNISTNMIWKIPENLLKLNATYNFTLVVQSKVNLYIAHKTGQQVVVVANQRLLLHIKCVRNCLRYQFSTDRVIHLSAQCDTIDGECLLNANFQWSVHGIGIGSSRRCLYRPKEFDNELVFMVEVTQAGLSGKTTMELKRNLPPSGGSCSIEPSMGVAFGTEFHIKCVDYQDVDSPLSYQYKAGDFPLERINDPAASVMLPECQSVLIVICDQLEACSETRLMVNVSALPKPTDLGYFLTEGKSNIQKLNSEGYNLAATILVKSLLRYVNTEETATEFVKHLADLTPLTLLECEQWLNICHDFSTNLQPLDNRKALALNKLLRKLSDGLETVIDDQEILDLHMNSFELSLMQIGAIMSDFARPWETMTEIHTLKPEMIKTIDPLAEHYAPLGDFDISILTKINNWLQTSRELHKCFELLSSQGPHMYHPQEAPFVVEDEYLKMKMYAFEGTSEQYIHLNNYSLALELPKDVIKDLQGQLRSESIILQTVLMKSNPFWWYPDAQPVISNVVYLSGFSSKSPTSIQTQFSKPFVATFHMEQLELLSSELEIEGVIKNQLHMPIFALQLPSNAAVVVQLQETQNDIAIEIDLKRKPRSFQVRQSQKIFLKNTTSTKQSYIALNEDSQTVVAYIAVLATKDVNEFPLSFRFQTYTMECLYWDWDLEDPQWSSKGCRIKVDSNGYQELQCECHHFSSFAVKRYTTPVDEDLSDRILLESLPLNMDMIAIFIVTFLMFVGILLWNFKRSQAIDHILMSDTHNDDGDVEVLIYTGSHWNATTTANIQLRFISERGPYSVTIYQNPQQPQLQRNSMCKLRLSSRNVSLPLKLTISNDQSGRYPNWYCREISVVNLLTHQSQLFAINQWISTKSLELISANSSQTLRQAFAKNLEYFYSNWFQLQPILGPSLYSDDCCFQRSCVCVSQTMVSLFILTWYYGPTTMTTYESEREVYYSLHFDIVELLILPLACFLSGIFIKWCFNYFCK